MNSAEKRFHTLGEDRMKCTSERLFTFDLASGPALEAKSRLLAFSKVLTQLT